MVQGYLDTPVALFVFNRPKETSLVFEKIREAKPRELLIISDGPRSSIAGERERNQLVLEITSRIDWDCRVRYNVSDINLGCRKRLQSGLSWVFSQVERAIILEDDCLPSRDFFEFMELTLAHYAKDESIGMVSGNNFLWPGRKKANGYYFSNLPHIWGWGSWSRAWSLYEPEASSWASQDQDELLKRVFFFKIFRSSWKSILDDIATVNTWDYQWCYTLWKNHLLSIVPKANLVENIGLNSGGTHTLHSDAHYQNQVGKLAVANLNLRQRPKVSKFRDFLELTVMRFHSARQLTLRQIINRLITMVAFK